MKIMIIVIENTNPEWSKKKYLCSHDIRPLKTFLSAIKEEKCFCISCLFPNIKNFKNTKSCEITGVKKHKTDFCTKINKCKTK